MEKWLKYKNIFGLIILKLESINIKKSKDSFIFRKISEEFNDLFEVYYVKQKQIKFRRLLEEEDLRIVKKYNMFKINLYKCENIIDNDLNYLINCREVYLSGCCNLIDEQLKYLSNCEKISLISGYNITNGGLSYLTNCKDLFLCGCKNITDEGLRYLSNCNALNFGYCKNITGKGFKYLVNCKKIILRCYNLLNNYIIKENFKYLVNCTKIYLYDINGLDEGLKALAESYSKENPCLYNCNEIILWNCNINDDSLKYLKNCEDITIVECRNINGNGLIYLNNCKKLYISKCNIESNWFEYLLEKNIDIDIILNYSKFTAN